MVACRWFGRRDWAAPALLLASATTIIVLQMGTTNPFLVLGIAAAWRFRNSRPLCSGAVLGLIAVAKLFLCPLLVWPLLTRRFRSAAAAVLVLVAAAGSQPLVGRMSLGAYLSMLSKLQDSEAVQSWSLASLVHGLGLSISSSGRVARAVSCVCLIGVWCRRRRLSDEQLLGVVTLSCLLLSPIVWSSYLVLIAVPVLIAGDSSGPIAVAALASWALVTPDAASPIRVAGGLVILVAVVVVTAIPFRPLRCLLGTLRRHVTTLLALIAAGLTLILVPPAIRSPLPSVMATAAVGMWVLRRGVHDAGGFPTEGADEQLSMTLGL